MGVICAFYVLEDKIAKKILRQELNLDDHIANISKELLTALNYEGMPIWRYGITYGTDKGWNATQELLNILDSSENKVLKKIIKDTRAYETYFYNSPAEVEEIWHELKKISFQNVEDALTPENINSILNTEGYGMHYIENKYSMFENFSEILNTYYNATKIGRKAVLNIIE